MANKQEPVEAFPYKPPSDEIREKYAHIFEIDGPQKGRFFKTTFDRIISTFLLVAAFSILLGVGIAYLTEGWLIPESKAPVLFHYNAASVDKIIPKHKN